MKGYSKLSTAVEAAGRLREQGYAVRIQVRNGWYVLELDTPAWHCGVPRCNLTGTCAHPEACHVTAAAPRNDNAPPEPPEAA